MDHAYRAHHFWVRSFPSFEEPTAQASLADVPATECNSLTVSLRLFGLGTMFQVLPLKCSIKVRLTYGGALGSCAQPTAQTSLLDTASTPDIRTNSCLPATGHCRHYIRTVRQSFETATLGYAAFLNATGYLVKVDSSGRKRCEWKFVNTNLIS